jgi:high-affinity iron transporter
MLATLIIVFRELIEAGLIIGIVLATTRGVPRRTLWVTYGILSGIAGACMVAVGANWLNGLMAGTGQEIFNAAILMVAVFMLGWHNVWMMRQGRQIAGHMKALGAAVTKGTTSLAALAVVVGVAVLREGAEVVLFLYGIALSGDNNTLSMVLGGGVGLFLGVLVAYLMYVGLLHIPTRHIFKVSSWLIALLAAGMATQAIGYMEQAGLITLWSQTVWDTSMVLDSGSVFGKVLHTLVGYTDRPSMMQLLVYILTLGTIFGLMRLFAVPNVVRNSKIAGI